MWLALFVEVALAKKPETAPLPFAWAPGDVAVTEFTSTQRKEQTGRPVEERSSHSTGRIEIHEAGEDLLMTSSSRGNDSRKVDGVAQPQDPMIQEMVAALGEVPVQVLIGPDGAWKGLANEAEFRASVDQAMDKFIASVLAKAPDDAARTRLEAGIAPLGGLLSPEHALRLMQAPHNWQTAFWSGAELTVGETYEYVWEDMNPLIQANIPYIATFRATAIVPCRPGRKAPKCAALEVIVSPQDYRAVGEASLRIAQESVTAMIPPGQPVPVMTLNRFEFEDRWTGLAEIGSLHPWSWTLERTQELEIAVEGASMLQSTRQTETYTWEWWGR